MQIAVWSNEGKGAGSTTLAAVMATLIAAKYNYKTLVTHTMTGDLSMEEYLLKPLEQEPFRSVGESNVDGLFRLINNGKLAASTVRDYCYSLLAHSNLDFLGTHRLYQATDRHMNNYMYLMYTAKKFYDVTVVDLDVDKEHPLFDRVLRETDILVAVGSQNAYRMQELVGDLKSATEKLKDKKTKVQLVLNRYDRSSGISLKKLTDSLDINHTMTIPYKTEIIDCCNRHELVDYVLRQSHGTKKTGFGGYMKDAAKLVDNVMHQFMEVSDVR